MTYDIGKGEFPADNILRDGDSLINSTHPAMTFSNVLNGPVVPSEHETSAAVVATPTRRHGRAGKPVR